MITPYIILGGIKIPYTVNNYERKGKKVVSLFTGLDGSKKIMYLQGDNNNLVTKYSFTLRVSGIENQLQIQRLFMMKGKLYLIDFQPITETFVGDDMTNPFYLSRAVYPDEERMSAVSYDEDGYQDTEYLVKIDYGPPHEDYILNVDDWDNRIYLQYPLYDDCTLMFSYIPQFKVILTEDPLYKWVNDDIQYYEFKLEEA